MISHKFKCIFIHIPKCAGTSVEKKLGHLDVYEGYYMQDHRTVKNLQPLPYGQILRKDIFQEFIDRGLRRLKKQHNPMNRLVVSKRQYEEYFKFTTVRNPFARIFSYYTAVSVDKKAQLSDETASFEDWLFRNIDHDNLRPQTDYLEDFDGNINMDFIVKFENFDEDFKKVCDRLGVENNDMPHMGKNKYDRSYQECFNGRTRALIEERHAKDLALFGYSFD